MTEIKATLVYGFLEAGKTTYIQDCIFNDFFHKRGSTLVLCFEEGECEYDAQRLSRYRTTVERYGGGEDITAFCRDAIARHDPGRVYVEMNGMMDGLRERLPGELKVVYSPMLIDGTTLPLYMTNLRQLLQNMVSACDMVTFNRCPRREDLAPYSRLFQLMNRRATYLWQGPGGYHEKAFDDLVPYDLDRDFIEIKEADLVAFMLDAAAHPEHYAARQLRLTGQVEGGARIGRTVMTCCMADLQFLGVAIDGEGCPRSGWFTLTGTGEVVRGPYGQGCLVLRPTAWEPVSPPDKLILAGS